MKLFNGPEFEQNILFILRQFAYPLWVVHPDKTVKCTCVDPTSKNAEPSCPKCLGTGYRIIIKRVEGVSLSGVAGFHGYGVSEQATVGKYYFEGKYRIYQDDLIVDGNEAFLVERVTDEVRDKNIIVYWVANANPKKAYQTVFLKNFNKIIGG